MSIVNYEGVVNFSYSVSVYIGRFQPFHSGHLALLEHALSQASVCVVVIGSAQCARSPKNPFSYDECKAMIEQALASEMRARVLFVPMRDYYNETRWARSVEREVQAALSSRGISNSATTALIGHFKDDSSSYLRLFAQWQLVSVPRQGAIDAAQLRAVLFDHPKAQVDTLLQQQAADMPAHTLQFLGEWLHTPWFDAMRSEAAAIRLNREAWANAPYPPVFVTVDVLLKCQQKVLLIQRKHAPGKDRYALPGGYLDQHETTLQSALRELYEETGLSDGDFDAEQCLRGRQIFDHPARSLVGRIITHAFYFDLGAAVLPAATAGDDAQNAEWIAVENLLALEDRLHDDHFMILDHFLKLLPE